MNIILASSEVTPFAKTGGLADVAGSLPIEFHALGHEVSVFMPRYQCINIQRLGLEPVLSDLRVKVGAEILIGRLYTYLQPHGVRYYFVDYPDFFNRDELYGSSLGDYGDNDVRFTFFQLAVLESIRELSLKHDVIHCHDWQTSLIPLYLKTFYAEDPLFSETRSVLTIHNMAYQGTFPPDSLPATGLDWEFFHVQGLEFYGKVNFLKAGILYADALTTVSPKYAAEIQTKEAGAGLEGVLQERSADMHGILNGLDYREWDPEGDPVICENYNVQDLEKRKANKTDLQKNYHLDVDDSVPLLGVVSRLVDQKGIDLLISILPDLVKKGIQIIILGTGEEKYHQALRDLASQYTGKISVHIVFDPDLARRIYAGADGMVIPSYYEPCGLAQMIAFRYGSVPIVRSVGGLADTVFEWDSSTKKGNGFLFEDYTSRALLSAIGRFVSVFEDGDSWVKLVKNGMQEDYSWSASAKKYEKLFEKVERKPVKAL